VKILVLTLLIYLAYLVGERVVHARRLRRIPLKIAVTGTRGKSSVTRLLASILREDGRRVLAKTTGTQPRVLLPNGNEIVLGRRGFPTIMEQKSLIKRASDLTVDCLIVEIMSIRPESHFVESHQLIQPDLLLITNIRRDHVAAMGRTEEEIASVFSLDIVEGVKVFMPATADYESIGATVLRRNGNLIKVPEGSWAEAGESKAKPEEFAQNLDLVSAAARHLQIESETIRRGISRAGGDVGKLRIWRVGSRADLPCYAVNAFAANDPQSTLSILSKVREILPSYRDSIIGLLNLRGDRPDRTEQWITALREGSAAEFRRIFLMGSHGHAVKRRVRSAEILTGENPEEIMRGLFDKVPEKALFFGFGNMGGLGRQLVEYWIRIGDDHGI